MSMMSSMHLFCGSKHYHVLEPWGCHLVEGNNWKICKENQVFHYFYDPEVCNILLLLLTTSCHIFC